MTLKKNVIASVFVLVLWLVVSTFALLPNQVSAVAIGDSYEGGVVAYILQSNDPGYESLKEKGLIVAPSDQSTGASWGCYGTSITGADGTAVGTGNQNTIDIMAGCATAGIAARLAGDLVLDVYDDWYLPSRDELTKIYPNRNNLGSANFSSVTYWSSSEVNAANLDDAFIYYFEGGNYSTRSKSVSFNTYVRAVRSFSIEISDLTTYNAALSAATEEDYTPESWVIYQDIVSENEVTKYDSQNEVDTATANIIDAQSGLIVTIIPTFAGGLGTSGSPYQISTCQQLEDINYTPNEGVNYPFLTDKYFILKNDIDCGMTNPDNDNFDADGTWGDEAGFMPIGKTLDIENDYASYGTEFVGSFNGNNYTISGLYINRPHFSGVGLFGMIGDGDSDNISLIKNLNIVNANIIGPEYTGVLAGGNVQYLSVSKVLVSGEINVSAENPNGDNAVIGGLIGQTDNSEIMNSVSNVNINTIDEQSTIGGLIGYIYITNISNSYSTGNITGTDTVGGLIGDISINGNDDNSNINNSYSVGTVTGVTNVGGLIGAINYNDVGTYTDYISNSGWYQTQNESNMKGIGSTSEDASGAEVAYKEIDSTAFYSKTHGVYALGQEGGWDFTTPIWYEHAGSYPNFVAPEAIPTPEVHRSHVTGSSSGAIARFQAEQQNLPVTPPVTPVLTPTPSTTNGTPLNLTRTLKLNMNGDDVKALQVYLNTHGFLLALTGPGSKDHETNKFGSLTKKAVIAFQKVNGLVADGIVGPLTLAKMK